MNPRKQYASSRCFNKKLLNFYVQDRIQQLVGSDFSPTTESSSSNNHTLVAGRVLYWETSVVTLHKVAFIAATLLH